MGTLLQNLRYASRQLTKAPAFALTAVLTLAIGIGGVTAVFSVVQAVILRPLPFKDPARLISLHEHFEQDAHELRVSAPDVLIFERKNQAFSAVAGFIASAYELTGAGTASRRGRSGSRPSLFPLLGWSLCWDAPLPGGKMTTLPP